MTVTGTAVPAISTTALVPTARLGDLERLISAVGAR